MPLDMSGENITNQQANRIRNQYEIDSMVNAIKHLGIHPRDVKSLITFLIENNQRLAKLVDDLLVERTEAINGEPPCECKMLQHTLDRYGYNPK